jgi:hypothetical protein
MQGGVFWVLVGSGITDSFGFPNLVLLAWSQSELQRKENASHVLKLGLLFFIALGDSENLGEFRASAGRSALS